MAKRRSTLSSSWSGAYRYPRDSYPETVFNAQFEENAAGAFTGSMQEPNLTHPDSGPINTAAVEGAREGTALNFMKFYNGDGGMGHFVSYDGAANADFTRVDGTWSIPGVWSGTFFMTRDDDGEKEAVEREVEVPIETRK